MNRRLVIPTTALFLVGMGSVCLAAEPGAESKECARGSGFAKASKVESANLPSLSPPAMASTGKALIFVFWRGSKLRGWKGAHVSLAIDGEWKAILPAKDTYMWFESDPGSLDLCNFGNTHGHMTLVAEAGHTYFIEGSPGGDLYGRVGASVREVSESEGKKAISEFELAEITFEGFSGQKFDEAWLSLHPGMLPEEVFGILGRMTPPEIGPNNNSRWSQDGYKFEFSKGKLRSWSKPSPFVFKVKK